MLGQIQSVVAALNGVATAPVGNGVVRFTAEHQKAGFDACAPWWRASLQWLLAIILVLIPLSWIFSDKIALWTLGSADHGWLIVVAAAGLPLAGASTLIASVINGQQLYRRYIALGMISVVGSTGITIFLVQQYGRDGALLAATLSAAVAGLVMIAGVIREPWFRLRYWFGRADMQRLRLIGGYVSMGICSAVCASVSVVLVRNILAAKLGWGDTGLWQAVFKISEIYLGVITMALSTYYLPRLSQLDRGEDIRSEILATAKVVLPIVATLAIGIYVLRDLALRLLFTEQFAPARDLFAVQLIGDVIKIGSWLCAYPMLSRGATRLFVGTEIAFSATFVALTWLLVGEFGLQGATIAFTLNYLIYLFVVIFLLPSSRSLAPARQTTGTDK